MRIPEIGYAPYEASKAPSWYQARHGPNFEDDAIEIARTEKENMLMSGSFSYLNRLRFVAKLPSPIDYVGRK